MLARATTCCRHALPFARRVRSGRGARCRGGVVGAARVCARRARAARVPDASIRARCAAPISGEPLARTMTAVFHRRGSALRAGVHAMPKKHRAARSAGLRGIGTKRPRRRPTRPAAGHRLRRAAPGRRGARARPRRLPRGPRASCAPARARRAACRGPRSFARSVGRTACLSAGFRANLPPRHTTDKHAATRRARAIRRPYCRSSRKREEEIWSRRGIARFMLKIRSIVAC